MAIDLEGKRLIVTGGARGIGAAAVVALAEAGATLVSLDVLDEPGENLIREHGLEQSVSYLKCDVTDRAAVNAAFDAAAATIGGIDGVVHIAGVERSVPAEDIDDALWDLMLDVNARGTMIVNQAAFRHLKANGGAIVNFASSAGMNGMPKAAAYAASKGAVLAWTRTVAVEWARYDIRVNAVAPGMWTPMYDEFRARLDPAALAKHDEISAQRIPLGGKLGDPQRDMAPVLVFLMSDAARFITAQTLCVDGGMLMTR